MNAVPIKFILMICAVLIIGWCMNVIKFLNSDFEAPYDSEIIRIAGIMIPPVGVIAGFIEIGEE